MTRSARARPFGALCRLRSSLAGARSMLTGKYLTGKYVVSEFRIISVCRKDCDGPTQTPSPTPAHPTAGP